MKTIFYRESIDDEGDYWIDNKPYNEWFTLENILYEPNSGITKTIVNKQSFVKTVTIVKVDDRFSDDGIIRRIALYIGE